MFYWNGCKVNVCEAANIDRCHRIALRINGLGIRMNATCLAEMVLDDVLVEGVRANTFLRCEQVQLIASTISLLPVPMADVPQLSWLFRKFDKQERVTRYHRDWHKQQRDKFGEEQGSCDCSHE